MDAIMTEPDVDVRCKIEEVFAGPFIELIALAPKNPVVRGLILAQTRKMPDLECETFDQIKEWVETTCQRKMPPLPAGITQRGEAFTIKVDFSEIENGRASYSVPCSGADEFVLNEEEVIAIVHDVIDEGSGFESVVESLSALINDDAWDRCDPNLDNGEFEYEQHDVNDTSNSEIEFSLAQIRERLYAFLIQNHPQLLEQLS